MYPSGVTHSVTVWPLYAFWQAYLYMCLFLSFSVMKRRKKLSKAPQQNTLLIKMQRPLGFQWAVSHQCLLLFSLHLMVDTIFRQWSLSAWLEYLKSQLDSVMKAVPVGADWSLIYTVPIGSCDCVRLSFSLSVWAFPGLPCRIIQL